MLSSIHIKNYALIDDLQVQFEEGFTTITGETGAGKSILLGGVSLALGKRVDFSNVKDNTQKSVIECVFQIENYNLSSFFESNGLDYDTETIIRREVLPSGKSRAFVNDSPVTLNVLEALGTRLIDIHSQHETLSLTNNLNQFQIIDALAQTNTLVEEYKLELKQYQRNFKTLTDLKQQKLNLQKDNDYNSYLLAELEDSKILNLDYQTLESEQITLSNVDDIQEQLSAAIQLLEADDVGLNTTLLDLKLRFQKLKSISEDYFQLYQRVESISIELNDIFDEVDQLSSRLELNPQRLEILNNQLQKIKDLCHKHNVSDLDALRLVYEQLQQTTSSLEGLDNQISKLEIQLGENLEVLNQYASKISEKRLATIPHLISTLEELLSSLGMPQAKFQISMTPSAEFLSNGKDQLSILIQTNKGGTFLPLGKGTSGGELSRIMLAIKYILSKHLQLPTIMFDEIDTGVSGEISNKMGNMMQEMSQYMQVFAITHLPQIAAKGSHHCKVYKVEKQSETITQLKTLDTEERLLEIAQMLAGDQVSNSAIVHAKQLLN